MRTLRPSLRSTLLAGGAVLILGGSTIGIAGAQSQPGAPTAQQTPYGKFLAALAKNLNVQPATLQSAITQSRTDAGLPAGGGFAGAGHHRRGEFRAGLTAIADYLQIQVPQLRTEMRTMTLAQIAGAHGKTAADLANHLKTAANARLDQAVASGKLTADQASERKTRISQRIDQLMTQVMPRRGPRAADGEDQNA